MQQLNDQGYQAINNVFSEKEITLILDYLSVNIEDKQFGLRAFLLNHPKLIPLIFNENLKRLIHSVSENSVAIKSIYFDKPPNANWIVNWHQDLTLNLKSKVEIEGFKKWRNLKDRTVVQAPIPFLEDIFTIRIHLDKCTKENGALRIIKQSHKNGIVEVKHGVTDFLQDEVICEVEKGGVLLMKPLVLHASRRTENEKSRRVIHIEFTSNQLPEGLEWNETFDF